MKITLLNHSSLLLEVDDAFLVTDPWVVDPAFGSWLPTFPPAIDPTALLALGGRLTVVISHLHGDHFDASFLSCLDPSTTICVPKFKSHHMVERLCSLGLENVTELIRSPGARIGPWTMSAFESRKSDVDATVVIRTETAGVIHGNDNWERWHPDDLALLRDLLADLDHAAIMNCSQANSASGYPLNYESFDFKRQDELLIQKVQRMCASGMQNSSDLGLTRWYPYAGYSSVFVKNHDEYRSRSIFPTPDRLRNLMSRPLLGVETPPDVEIADFLPGDSVRLPSHELSPGFIRRAEIDLSRYREASDRLLRATGAVDTCETFSMHQSTSRESAHRQLLALLGDVHLASQMLIADRPDVATSLTRKRFGVEVRDLGLYAELNFETAEIAHQRKTEPEETLVITSQILASIVDGSMRANHLYIGYQGIWRRSPPDQFNADIRSVLATYTYRVQVRARPTTALDR